MENGYYNNDGQKPEEQNNSGPVLNKGPVVRNMMETPSGRTGNGLSVTSLVCGIMSIVLCWGCGISIAVGLAGIICGIISLAKDQKNQGMAAAGLITSAIGLILGVILVVLYLIGSNM